MHASAVQGLWSRTWQTDTSILYGRYQQDHRSIVAYALPEAFWMQSIFRAIKKILKYFGFGAA